jgi:cobalt-zinc-cadmium resistance protein CzcA
VVLLLGNWVWISGSLCYSIVSIICDFVDEYFGIDANLMSLGAIDFGIDGAVIIVEFIAFQIASKAAQLGPLSKEDRQIQIDQITYNGASKMMNSAIFGQLIILIVFIPFFLFQVSKVKCLNPYGDDF